MLGIIAPEYCILGLGLLLGTALSVTFTMVLTPAITAVLGAAESGIIVGTLHAISSTSGAGAVGASYGFIFGDMVCSES